MNNIEFVVVFIIAAALSGVVCIFSVNSLHNIEIIQHRHKLALQACKNEVLQDNNQYVTCKSGAVFQYQEGFTKSVDNN